MVALPDMYVLTPVDLQKIRTALRRQTETEISLDAGKTAQPVTVTTSEIRGNGFTLPLPPSALLNRQDDRTILIFRNGHWEKWQYFNPTTQRLYKPVFVAEGKPPTIEISGIKMHVTENGAPWKDTRRKVSFLKATHGIVWDTCCGMGYSAMALARLPGVRMVITTEVDPTVLSICRENPWAQDLWRHDAIQVVHANSTQFVRMLRDRTLGAVLHDPPRYALAPELYELPFYQQLHRVLRAGGVLYHYTGNPRKHQEKGLPIRTAERLRKAGFGRVRQCYQGVCARK